METTDAKVDLEQPELMALWLLFEQFKSGIKVGNEDRVWRRIESFHSDLHQFGEEINENGERIS